MRAFVIFGLVCLVCLSSRPAAAMTCEEVRGFVQTYGVSLVLAYAKSTGATPLEIRRGRACLHEGQSGHRKHIGRTSNAGWVSN
jgi:hypothetical protein